MTESPYRIHPGAICRWSVSILRRWIRDRKPGAGEPTFAGMDYQLTGPVRSVSVSEFATLLLVMGGPIRSRSYAASTQSDHRAVPGSERPMRQRCAAVVRRSTSTRTVSIPSPASAGSSTALAEMILVGDTGAVGRPLPSVMGVVSALQEFSCTKSYAVTARPVSICSSPIW